MARAGKGRRARRGSRLTPRRWLPFLVFVALIAALVVSRDDEAVEPPTNPVARAGGMLPVAAGADALSTAFFCSGGSAAGEGGPAEMVLLIANAAPVGTTADLTFVGADGATAEASVDVPAAGRARVEASEHLQTDWVGVTVEVLGPEVSVEKIVSGPRGFERNTCPTTASATWYVPSGSTAIGAEEQLVLYNPFPADSSIDISFVHEDGRSTPQALRGFTLPARSVRVIDATLLPSRKDELAAILRARTGRFVVDRVQSYDGTGAAVPAAGDAGEVPPPTGLASTPGIATTSTRWAFPDAVSAEGTRQQIAVLNPSSRTAELSVVLTHEDPQRRSEIEPIQLTLPGGQLRMVDLRWVPGMEVGEPYTVRLDSLSIDGARAVAVVAEQLVFNAPPPTPPTPSEAPEEEPEEETGPEGEGERQEASPEEMAELEPVDGFSVVGGSPVMAPNWLVSASGTSDIRAGTVVVVNPTDEMVRVRVETAVGGRREPLGEVLQVPAGDRRTVDLSAADPNAVLVLRGSAPIVVSRTVVSSRGGKGVSLSLGAPLPDGVRTLPPAS